MDGKVDIFVFAHWQGMHKPELMGVLSSNSSKGKRIFSFEYAKTWLGRKEPFLLDPEIGWFSGIQYPAAQNNFGIFFDSMPDTMQSNFTRSEGCSKTMGKGC